MNKNILALLIIGICCCSSIYAQDESNSSKPPWRTGGEYLPVRPLIPNPVIKMTITDENGQQLPKEITEDVPLTVMANSDIFFDEPVEKSITRNFTFHDPQWLEKPSSFWFVNDWKKNKATPASTSYDVAPNQMVIIPTTPAEKGAISCFTSRKMCYIREDGQKVTCFANSSDMRGFKVKDITPPTCGLEISVVDGETGKCWPIENPPNHYPLPKTADMCFSGELFNSPSEIRVIEGFELGSNMIVKADDGGINLKKTDVIKVKVIGDDNYKIDPDKLKYGVCNGAGGEPSPASAENADEIDFTKFLIPENPYLYLDASDMAGNRQILFIPINIVE